jgi:hypothetical protein
MLGLFTIWRGETLLREKVNEIEIGFSRDGFHWDRPERSTFLGVSPKEGDWNWANVQSAGGCCLVVGDQLFFYVSGRQGRPGTSDPGVCTTGLAKLRRDGFASMDWLPDGGGIIRGRVGGAGTLTTRPVQFKGRHLFVNGDFQQGQLRVEVLDQQRRRDRAVYTGARTLITRMEPDRSELQDASLADPPDTVRFRFTLTRPAVRVLGQRSQPARARLPARGPVQDRLTPERSERDTVFPSHRSAMRPR